jgi:outer membrane protein OmpU
MRENQMKKVLLASTALVFTTGWAMADVTNGGDDLGASITLEGFAEMGVFGNDAGDNADLQFHTDIDLTFVMLGSTDTGLEFGAEIDIDETDSAASGISIERDEDGNIIDINVDDALVINRDGDDGVLDFTIGGSPAFDNSLQGGEEIFIRGAFGTLTMGDTDGAFDWALQEAIIGDSLTDNHEHAGYSGNAGLDGLYDGQIARYEYAFGDFAFAVSAEIDDTDVGDPIFGIGGTYDFVGNGFTLALGAAAQFVAGLDENFFAALDEDEDYDSVIAGISADVGLDNGLRVIGNYSWRSNEGDNDIDDDGEHWGVAVGYEFDALLIAANYGVFEGFGFGEIDSEGFGLIANYDLGGGASLQAGYGYNDIEGVDSFNTYSFGVAMNF